MDSDAERPATIERLNETSTETELSPLLHRSSESTLRSSKSYAWQILALTCITLGIIDFAGFLGIPPQTKIFEDVACENFYRNSSSATNFATRDCKVDPVQAEVALLNGWKDTFDQIPGLLLALPYGLLADRIGRRPVLILGQIGIILEDILIKIICWWPHIFPLRLVWLCCIAQVIGGGAQVASAMIWTIVADSFEDRTSAFFRVYAAVLVAEMTANPASAAMMTAGPWIPFFASLAIQCVGVLMSFSLPETLRYAELNTSEPEPDSSEDTNSIKSNSGSAKSNLMQRATSSLRDLVSFARRGNLNFYALMFVFLVAALGRQSATWLLLYTSRKFGWTFGKASLLLSLRAVINLVLLVIILPLLSRLFLKFANSGIAGRDLRISQASIILSTIGAVLIGFAAAPASLIFGVVVFALGSAFPLTARSLITSLVSPNQVGTLYTALGFVAGCGTLIAGPMLAYSYHEGLVLGDPWLGLLYLVTGGLFLLSGVAMGCVRLKGLQQTPVNSE